MLWLDNDEGLYRESCNYFQSIQRYRKRPTYKGLIEWLSEGEITARTPDDVPWLSDTLNYKELDRGILINYDCWLQVNN
jgi:hypothetical protein